jgi:hypothetical protein
MSSIKSFKFKFLNFLKLIKTKIELNKNKKLYIHEYLHKSFQYMERLKVSVIYMLVKIVAKHKIHLVSISKEKLIVIIKWFLSLRLAAYWDG